MLVSAWRFVVRSSTLGIFGLTSTACPWLPPIGEEGSFNPTLGDAGDLSAAPIETEGAGSEDPTETQESETSTDSDAQDCHVDVPPLWQGPVSRVTDPGGETICPGGGEPILETLFGLSVSPSTCACSCGEVESADCQGNQIFERFPLQHDSCAGEPFDTLEVPIGVTANADFMWLNPTVASVPISSGICEPIDTSVHPDPTWAVRTLACPIDATTPCDAVEQCVFRPGKHACPAAFPIRQIEYEGVSDSRSCAPACECTSPSGECELVNELLEFLPYEVIFGVGECRGMSRLVRVRAEVDLSSCAPNKSTPSGEVMPIDPVTYCCTHG